MSTNGKQALSSVSRYICSHTGTMGLLLSYRRDIGTQNETSCAGREAPHAVK
jgi:hypothetical protein